MTHPPSEKGGKITPKLWGGLGEKKSNDGRQWYQQNRIYDSEYIAMCLPANLNNSEKGGGYYYIVKDKKRN